MGWLAGGRVGRCAGGQTDGQRGRQVESDEDAQPAQVVSRFSHCDIVLSNANVSTFDLGGTDYAGWLALDEFKSRENLELEDLREEDEPGQAG